MHAQCTCTITLSECGPEVSPWSQPWVGDWGTHTHQAYTGECLDSGVSNSTIDPNLFGEHDIQRLLYIRQIKKVHKDNGDETT